MAAQASAIDVSGTGFSQEEIIQVMAMMKNIRAQNAAAVAETPIPLPVMEKREAGAEERKCEDWNDAAGEYCDGDAFCDEMDVQSSCSSEMIYAVDESVIRHREGGRGRGGRREGGRGRGGSREGGRGRDGSREGGRGRGGSREGGRGRDGSREGGRGHSGCDTTGNYKGRNFNPNYHAPSRETASSMPREFPVLQRISPTEMPSMKENRCRYGLKCRSLAPGSERKCEFAHEALSCGYGPTCRINVKMAGWKKGDGDLNQDELDHLHHFAHEAAAQKCEHGERCLHFADIKRGIVTTAVVAHMSERSHF
jgi:hypothetical protein